MTLADNSRRYEFADEDAKDIGGLFADLKRGVEALEWMLSTNAGETLTHHFELCYLLRNIKAAVTSSAGRLPSAACSLSQSEMYKLLCEGPLLDLTGGVTTAVTFVKLLGEEGKSVRVVLEGLSEAERRLIKFMERPHEAHNAVSVAGEASGAAKAPRIKKQPGAKEAKPRANGKAKNAVLAH
jgi:hypothetical protein